MERLYYIGLDIHKKTISYCIKKVDGTVVQQGKIAAETQGTAQMDGRSARTLVGGHGGHHFHRLGL